ncbi:hypothetical protein ES705_08204 [subsurface metagenome]
MENKKNITWQLNNLIIRNSYVDLIEKLHRKPTQSEVSKDCKLSENTISKHIDTLSFEPLKNSLRILSDDVLISIYHTAMAGSTGSQRLWLQVSEGWSERLEVAVEVSPSLVELVKKYRDDEARNKSKMQNLITVLKNCQTKGLSLELACEKFREDENIDLSEIVETIGKEKLTLSELIQEFEHIETAEKLKNVIDRRI